MQIGWALATTHDNQWWVEEWCQRAMAKAGLPPMPAEKRAAHTLRVDSAYAELERERGGTTPA